MSDPVYLDSNATTPLRPEVREAMQPWIDDAANFGNPSSGHVYGQRTKAAIETARQHVAALIGASETREIVFTGGGTEASNIAIVGSAWATPTRDKVVTSVIEHPATEQPCRLLEHQGRTVVRVPVGADGRLKASDVIAACDDHTVVVSIMHANNETGALQPIHEIAAGVLQTGALVHTDAAQSLGKLPVDVNDLGVHLLTIAGHKLYAPKGVGALYVREGTPIDPVLRGAGHERGLRPGTENVPWIVALGEAARLAREESDAITAHLRDLRDDLWNRLQVGVPGIAINGPADPALRMPNTLSTRFPNVSGNALLAATPQIAASTGSACHEGGESASAVILAMGLSEADALGTVRLSVGHFTTADEVATAAAALIESWTKLTTR